MFSLASNLLAYFFFKLISVIFFIICKKKNHKRQVSEVCKRVLFCKLYLVCKFNEFQAQYHYKKTIRIFLLTFLSRSQLNFFLEVSLIPANKSSSRNNYNIWHCEKNGSLMFYSGKLKKQHICEQFHIKYIKEINL